MAIGLRIRWLACGMIFTAVVSAKSFADDPASTPAATETPNRYAVNALLFSCMPDDELGSYKLHFDGNASGSNVTLGFGAFASDVEFQMDVVCQMKAKRFIATVKVKPGAKDKVTKQENTEIDLTDLQPKTLEVSRATDGRVFRLNLTPKIDVPAKPVPFAVKDFKLEAWSFPNSPVLLNNQDFLGTFNGGSAALAWCEIPGIAKVEFSLLHIKDAKVMGTLKNGVVKITNDDGAQFEVSNVKNGKYDETLPGGPYQVWVRWQKPTYSVEEAKKMIEMRFAAAKEAIKNGSLTLPEGTLEKMERAAKSDRPMLISFGTRYVPPSDVVADEAKK